MPQPFQYPPQFPDSFVFGGKVMEQPVVYWDPYIGASIGTSLVGAGTVNFVPFQLPVWGNFTAADVFVSGNFSATNAISSQAQTLSVSVGIYSKYVSSLSLAASGSATYAVTVTGSSSSNLYNGVKALTVPLTANLAPGNYWYAVNSVQSSAGNQIGAAGGAISNCVYSLPGQQSTYAGVFGQSVTKPVEPCLLTVDCVRHSPGRVV